MPDIPDLPKSKELSVVLIVPNDKRRRALATLLAEWRLRVDLEFGHYPSQEDLAEVTRLNCDVAIVDLDDDVDQAVRGIESLCGRNAAITVMAYSARNDSTLMRRSMQAGAREFLIEPLLPAIMHEAFARISSRRTSQEKVRGKMLVFVPTKGGVGVTTLATNFAMSLTKESGARVVVVDLDFQLGEIALGLGMTPAFSVVDALRNAARLDREFLSTLLTRHSSGLAVLGSPEEYGFFHFPVDDGAEELFRILREEFDYVVVDTGTCHGHIQEALFSTADKLYLVTELSFPSLRNAHRLIGYLSATDSSRRLEVILNRFNSRNGDIDEANAIKAMARPINWRIPNASAAARAAQDSGVPLAMENSPITRALGEMAKAVCGKPFTADKKATKRFSLFGSKAMSEVKT